jgi:hypothetical protein
MQMGANNILTAHNCQKDKVEYSLVDVNTFTSWPVTIGSLIDLKTTWFMPADVNASEPVIAIMAYRITGAKKVHGELIRRPRHRVGGAYRNQKERPGTAERRRRLVVQLSTPFWPSHKGPRVSPTQPGSSLRTPAVQHHLRSMACWPSGVRFDPSAIRSEARGGRDRVHRSGNIPSLCYTAMSV